MEDFCPDRLDWVDIDRRARPQGRYQSCDLCACQSRDFCFARRQPCAEALLMAQTATTNSTRAQHYVTGEYFRRLAENEPQLATIEPRED